MQICTGLCRFMQILCRIKQIGAAPYRFEQIYAELSMFVQILADFIQIFYRFEKRQAVSQGPGAVQSGLSQGASTGADAILPTGTGQCPDGFPGQVNDSDHVVFGVSHVEFVADQHGPLGVIEGLMLRRIDATREALSGRLIGQLYIMI